MMTRPRTWWVYKFVLRCRPYHWTCEECHLYGPDYSFWRLSLWSARRHDRLVHHSQLSGIWLVDKP